MKKTNVETDARVLLIHPVALLLPAFYIPVVAA